MENKLNRTKKDYEALNKQLIDELQILSRLIHQVILKSFKIFVYHTKTFIGGIEKSLKNDILSSRIDFSKDFNSYRIFMASTIDRMLAPFTGEFQTNIVSQADSACVLQTQTQEEKNRVLNNFPTDKIYIVTKRYVANLNLYHLSNNINDIVGLRKPYNQLNDPNFWFVYNGKVEGFIPAMVLEPYEKFYNQNNLICFDDDIHHDNSTSQVNCVAGFSFQANASNMISLIQGHHYKIIAREDQNGNSEWWLVEDKNGNIGYAPSNYLKILN